ncbi:hypothetical protein [Terrabacter sp. BE26]|uniref:hypothetical protein n=1 Tax=Terrabacter sp. BE26 TaxID=2898152 RepID=UPI0035BE8241
MRETIPARASHRVGVVDSTVGSGPESSSVLGQVRNAVWAWLVRYWVPLTIFAASRVVDTIFLAVAAEHQVAMPTTRPDYYVYEPTPQAPGYLGIVSNWDAQWYRRIATDGYQVPTPKATPADAHDTLWTWAFPPAYPLMVRAVMLLTSLPFTAAATVVSCVVGAGAMVLMYRLVLRSGGAFLAAVTVLFSCFFVSAPLLQIGYSESLALLFLMAALNLVVDRHYFGSSAAVLALSMTRLVTLPFVVVVLVHAYLRYRSEGPFWKTRRSGAAALALLGAVSIFGLFSWMLLASLFIGTQAGMARSAGQRSLHLGWFEDTLHLFGVVGLALLVLFVFMLVVGMLLPSAKAWAPELRAWSVAYPVFIFAMTPMLPAVMRYMLLAPTLPVLLAGTPRRASRLNVLWVGVVLLLLIAAQRWYAANIIVVWTEGLRPAP